MSRRRMDMRKVKEVLRLKFEKHLPNRQIARACNVSHSTVADYVERARASGISWPIDENWDDQKLSRCLFPQDKAPAESKGRPHPNWSDIHLELKKKGVTLQLLCEEYHEEYPHGIRYSQFCAQYAEWKKKLNAVMRQNYRWGEKSFVDYAGQTVPIQNPKTGETWNAEIFICVLGASNYTYCEAQTNQKLFNWIQGHVRAFDYFQGVPDIIVPDNLKSAVTVPCRYESDVNPTYQNWAEHYGVAVIPARIVKPKDKAKVEVGVQIVERWILARLRNQTFFSLQELNLTITGLLEQLNNRPMRHLDKSRQELFESQEKPHLKRLPDWPFEYCEWSRQKLASDYHVRAKKNFYSAPYKLIGRRLDIRMTEKMIEIFHNGKSVGTHVRTNGVNEHSTHPFHMPPGHRKMLEWTPESFREWSRQIGEWTHKMICRLQSTSRHPEQQSRSCLGLMRLSSQYESSRIEAACKRALRHEMISYKSVLTILKTGMDRVSETDPEISETPVNHRNIRGNNYYQ